MQTRSKIRLLVVRLGAMGDILHALPAVTALRKMHPAWVIDWVVEPKWQALLSAEGTAEGSGPLNAARPVVDRLRFAATKQWRKAPFSSKTLHEIKALRSSLRDAEYDIVLDLQGSLRSAVIGSLTGSHRRIGEAAPREAAARWFFTETVVTTGAHVIEQDVELASAIAGDELQTLRPWLPIDPAAEVWADTVLPPGSSEPAVLINPGAGWGAKRWPVERYAAVAQGLVAQGCRAVVNAGPGELPLAETIVRAAGGSAVALTPSLGELIALTRRVSLAIAGDTGPLHLACALGRPVVGIYGPTDPSRNGPFGAAFKVLRSPQSRRDHTRYATPEAGLLTISPEEVLRAAGQLLYPETEPESRP